MVDFLEPILKKDIAACTSLIKELKTQYSSELSAWEQPLVSLINALEQHFDPQVLLTILKELPPEINEALYRRICSSTEIAKKMYAHIHGAY